MISIFFEKNRLLVKTDAEMFLDYGDEEATDNALSVAEKIWNDLPYKVKRMDEEEFFKHDYIYMYGRVNTPLNVEGSSKTPKDFISANFLNGKKECPYEDCELIHEIDLNDLDEEFYCTSVLPDEGNGFRIIDINEYERLDDKENVFVYFLETSKKRERTAGEKQQCYQLMTFDSQCKICNDPGDPSTSVELEVVDEDELHKLFQKQLKIKTHEKRLMELVIECEEIKKTSDSCDCLTIYKWSPLDVGESGISMSAATNEKIDTIEDMRKVPHARANE